MAHELTPAPSGRLASRTRVRNLPAYSAGLGPRMRPDTFERLFEEHAERLFSFLAYRTGNRTLAEDLLSETFERVLRSRQRFDPRRGSERRWLYTIALNLLRDHARRQTHEERVLRTVGAGSSWEDGDAGIAAVEHRDELQRALATLGEDEREALALRFGADLKLRDVARILGDGESAVEGRIYRALRKLRAELD
ncbi:MAG TPA: sigma-70 family RNA polymerase sigma factor [Solirubrobacteraceae bacterium]|nr:sigma-70 family RNA polymerase sigma factor [Solirubrobacteraceae bacterium]